MDDDRFLVTGAYGCIGVWVLRELVAAGATVVALDLATGSRRLDLVVGDAARAGLIRTQADIADLAALERIIDEHHVTRVIHLAALQVPFCRADPPGGAAVNVVGTANVLEATRRRADRIGHVVYASSIAAYDAYTPGREPSMLGAPGTIYGVYKRANEQMALRYWLDEGVKSIGLRPHTVFGPGRDQGLTSAPTTAMLAAAALKPYRIPYGGSAQFQYVPDVARSFVAAALAPAEGAAVCNLAGSVRSMAEVVAAIVAADPRAEGLLGHGDDPLAFPASVEPDGLEAAIGALAETPFEAAVGETVARFREALAAGQIAAPEG